MKALVRIFGIALSLAAVVFVGMAVYRSFDALQKHLTSPLFLAAVTASAFAYATIVQLCALAWRLLLAAVDDPSLSVGQALAICGRAQIYKYLPSNVLHMVGRYSLSRKAGASNRALAFAQIAELLTIVLAAAAISALFARAILVHAFDRHRVDSPACGDALVTGGLVVLAISVAVAVYLRMARRGRRALVGVALAFILYVLFFIGSGLLVVLLCRSLSDASVMAELIGIGAVAWLVGFVVPGAPGGLGVRETVLITGLSTAGIPTTEATAVALGYRFVTVVGDCLVLLTILVGEWKKCKR